MAFNKLLFGTAGIPISTEDRSTVNGVKRVKELGLGAMELEFVRMVNLNEKSAVPVKIQAEKDDIIMTCHGQYFINLNSLEKEKIEASKKRIINAASIAHKAGAFSLVFHAAYYMKIEPEKVYAKVRSELNEIIKKLQDADNPIWIRPETTGKGTQFGELKEILKLSQELEQVMPCIDFAHLFARSIGKMNNYEDFRKTMEATEQALGRKGLENMHIHMSGIEHGQKGEKNHLILTESKFNYVDVLKVLKEFKAKGVVISESPNIEEDALLMKKTYANI